MGGVWDDSHTAYLFGGVNGAAISNSVLQYDKGGTTYDASGTSTIVYTPASGQTHDWQGATVNRTLNGQTASVQYTTNTNCSTGLASDITTLANSESLCIKLSLSTTDTAVSPSLDDVTLTYSLVSSGGDTGGSGSSATPTPSSTSSAAPGTTPSATPLITKIVSCTQTVSNMEIVALESEATVTFTSTNTTKGKLYFYAASKATPAGAADTKAANYTQGSQLVEETVATKNHTLHLTGLTPTTTYFFTLLSGTTQDCEHSFTTATPPTPVPIAAVTQVPTPSPSEEPCTQDCQPPRKTFLGFLTNNRGLTAQDTGALVAGISALATLGLGLSQAVSTTAQAFLNLPSYLRYLLPWKKKKTPWGKVISADTSLPVPASQVLLYDTEHYNRVIDRSVTDKEGRFGFYIEPGSYGLKVSRAGFTFPSSITKNGYHGEPIHHKDAKIVQFDVPIDPTTPRSLAWFSFERLVTLLQIVRIPILVLGSIFTILNYFGGITPLLGIMTIYYLYLWYLEYQRRNYGSHLLTLHNENNKPLAFAVVRLKSKNGAAMITKTTNSQGKTYILVEKGDYTLSITPPSGTTAQKGLEQTLKLPRGILTRPLIITLGHSTL